MPSRRTPAQRRVLATWVLTAAGVLSVAAVAAPSAFVVEGPGPAINTLGTFDGQQVLTIKGKTTYPSDSTLDLTTVSVAGGPGRELLGLEVVKAWIDPTEDVRPQEFVYPAGTTGEESDQQNAIEMTDSQQSAVAAALSQLKISYQTQAQVGSVVSDTNEGILEPGDLILSVDGTAIDNANAVIKAVRAGTASTVKMEIERSGKRQTVNAKVAVGTDLQGESVRQLGITVGLKYTFPLDVTFGLESIGGPSAGTMMALGIIDKLTPGSLAGDLHVAGTGTIDQDGTVGAIGGIPQKVAGAKAAGATVFLAPAANCSELSGRVPRGIDVYSIDTLASAEQLLETLAAGGDTSSYGRCG